MRGAGRGVSTARTNKRRQSQECLLGNLNAWFGCNYNACACMQRHGPLAQAARQIEGGRVLTYAPNSQSAPSTHAGDDAGGLPDVCGTGPWRATIIVTSYSSHCAWNVLGVVASSVNELKHKVQTGSCGAQLPSVT
jgi:hypothetical protein